jgi:hypothetical protein
MFCCQRLLWRTTNYELEKQVSENLFDFQLLSAPFFKTKTTWKNVFLSIALVSNVTFAAIYATLFSIAP